MHIKKFVVIVFAFDYNVRLFARSSMPSSAFANRQKALLSLLQPYHFISMFDFLFDVVVAGVVATLNRNSIIFRSGLTRLFLSLSKNEIKLNLCLCFSLVNICQIVLPLRSTSHPYRINSHQRISIVVVV